MKIQQHARVTSVSLGKFLRMRGEINVFFIIKLIKKIGKRLEDSTRSTENPRLSLVFPFHSLAASCTTEQSIIKASLFVAS